MLRAEHPGRARDPRRHRRHGRAQLRPREARRDPRPRRGGGARRLVARGRDAAAGRRASRMPRSSTASWRRSCRRSRRRREPSARRRSATAARSAATSALRLPPAMRCRRCSWTRPRSSSPARHAARGRMSVREFLARAEAERPRGRRADRGRARPTVRVSADVHEGGPAERDGDRRLLARGRGRPGARRDPCLVRLGWPCARLRARATRTRRGSLPEVVSAACSPIDDVRGHGRVSSPRTRRPRRPRSRKVPRGMRIEATVNGERHAAEVWPGESLLFTLRERLGLPGSKNACEQGECGSCSVLLDGKLVCSCLVLAAQADGHEIVTVEGLGDGDEPASGADRVRRGGRRAVRVLYARARGGGGRSPGACAESRQRTTSARPCPATSAAAPAIRRSSTR